jgi:hypothetical protein
MLCALLLKILKWRVQQVEKQNEKGGTKARGVRKRYERRSEDRGR